MSGSCRIGRLCLTSPSTWWAAGWTTGVRQARDLARWCTRCWPASRSTPTSPPCETAARTQARLLGATADDAAAATDAARRVLASSWIRRAAASGACRREVPLTLSDGEDAIIEGVADLVFEEAGAWVVVEFKTDVEIGRLGLERYRRQVGLYVAAIARATGRNASGVLLREVLSDAVRTSTGCACRGCDDVMLR